MVLNVQSKFYQLRLSRFAPLCWCESTVISRSHSIVRYAHLFKLRLLAVGLRVRGAALAKEAGTDRIQNLATVITSLASAIPVVGDSIVTWLWGGFSVDNATLNRFFSLHYLLPFIIAAVSLLHIAALHQYGSNNPLGINSSVDKIAFYPYFYVKDLVGWVAFALFFSIFVFFAPNVLGHPDNYIPANPMSTPAHIVPEWYFRAPLCCVVSLGAHPSNSVNKYQL
jgi:Cytochrome b/b6/petB/Cytochrome b(C-terminal)/b6/petD